MKMRESKQEKGWDDDDMHDNKKQSLAVNISWIKRLTHERTMYSILTYLH